MRRTSKAATAGSTKRLGRSKPALLLCVLVASVAALALVVGSASGATTRFLVEVFGSSAQPTFPADRGMAFDQGASQLYVIDSTNDTIARFNANGTAADFGALGSNTIDGVGTGDETPLGHLAFEANRQREQIAIDESGGATDGNIYATRSASDVVDVFSSTGEYKGTLSESTGTGPFGEPCGVAVDAAGNVYVGDRGDDRIHVYEPAGAVPVNADNTASFATVTDPCTLAAGSAATAGFLFVNASTGAQLRKVDAASGEVKYEIATGGSTVSVDPATGHVFVARNTGSSSQVDEYDASGAGAATLVSSFKPGQTVEGIALNSGAEQVYVARASTENVEVFGPAVLAPDVVTSPVASNTGYRATLAGTVNPDGVELDECFFEWGQDIPSTPPVYGNTAPCAESPAEIGAGTSPVAVHADIEGLLPNNRTYEFRLVAANPGSTVNGTNQTFTTPNTVVTESASGVNASEATLHGLVNPDGASLSDCVFEVGPPREPGEEIQKYDTAVPCTPSAAGIGSGTSPIAVSATASGLDPGSSYNFRLKATYPSGPAAGADRSLQTLGPALGGAWVEDVLRREASLKASIDPEGAATTYHFEWGTTAGYGNTTPELAVGADSSVHEVTRQLTDLAPGTTYHYRVIAASEVATSVGPDRTFTTFDNFRSAAVCPNNEFRVGVAADLPNCRAYEMVSPVDKNGADILDAPDNANTHRGYMQSSVSGDKLAYSAFLAFGDQPSNLFFNQYVASRGPGAWTTHGINAPQGKTLNDPAFAFGEVVAKRWAVFTPDLSSAWVYDYNYFPLVPEGQEGYINVYRRDNLTDSYEALTVNPPLLANNKELGISGVEGVSADGSHAVFSAEAALTADAASNTIAQVYDYTSGALHLVSVLPNGEPDPNLSRVGTGLGTEGRGNLDRAVSSDGSRVFWTSGPSTLGGRIYVRLNPERDQSALDAENNCTEEAKACTVAVSESVSSASAFFESASTDGSEVVFSIADPVEPGVRELYSFNVDSQTAAPIAHRVVGVLGASEDLSHIYFVSKEALTPDAVTDEPNLYVDHNGEVAHVATLGAADISAETLMASAVDRQPINRATRVTPDGEHLAFQSMRSLTGYDNTDAVNGKANVEVFTYDADSDELLCASCNPTGARPVGENLASPYVYKDVAEAINYLTGQWGAGWIPTWQHPLYDSRVLSDDGERLFFHSSDALVPSDSNGVRDLYQWEAQGSRGCERSGGCIDLISSGESPDESEFIDASPTGDDVFFTTSSSLAADDPGLIDIYDARVNGGHPPAAAPADPCVGDSCQSPPPARNDPTPASASFRGAGNASIAPRCGAIGRRAVRLSRRAKRLRNAANRARTRGRRTALRRRSARTAKRARVAARTAGRCRRSVGGGGR